jgi:hypothetical protein
VYLHFSQTEYENQTDETLIPLGRKITKFPFNYNCQAKLIHMPIKGLIIELVSSATQMHAVFLHTIFLIMLLRSHIIFVAIIVIEFSQKFVWNNLHILNICAVTYHKSTMEFKN